MSATLGYIYRPEAPVCSLHFVVGPLGSLVPGPTLMVGRVHQLLQGTQSVEHIYLRRFVPLQTLPE